MIRKLPLQQGVEETLTPGKRGERRAVRRALGIPPPAALWKELTDIARRRRVRPPAPRRFVVIRRAVQYQGAARRGVNTERRKDAHALGC